MRKQSCLLSVLFTCPAMLNHILISITVEASFESSEAYNVAADLRIYIATNSSLGQTSSSGWHLDAM